jgi:hypothetical protein
MVVLNRQIRHTKDEEEEYRGLLGGEHNNASLNGATTTTSVRSALTRHVRGGSGDRFSTAILVCCVFLLGVLYGSHSSNDRSKTVAMFPSNVAAMMKRRTPRDVHVGSMCRCGAAKVPIPDVNKELISIYQQVPKKPEEIGEGGHDTRVIQPPSKATGSVPKRFLHYPVEGCQCFGGNGRIMPEPTSDPFLSQISRDYFLRPENAGCQNPETESQTNWDQMPDFGVEDLPIFVGVLSYKSPLSLNNTLHNWLKHDLFHRIGAQDVFVQLNRRSHRDDEVVYEFQKKINNRHPMTILGSAEENLHPGLAISKYCRMAEEHPSSHPNGENLVLFLEKDWIIPDGSGKEVYVESIFRSAIALSQRGVPYVSFKKNKVPGSKTWNCPAEGIGWM